MAASDGPAPACVSIAIAPTPPLCSLGQQQLSLSVCQQEGRCIEPGKGITVDDGIVVRIARPVGYFRKIEGCATPGSITTIGLTKLGSPGGIPFVGSIGWVGANRPQVGKPGIAGSFQHIDK